jgi:hypothetical protein
MLTLQCLVLFRVGTGVAQLTGKTASVLLFYRQSAFLSRAVASQVLVQWVAQQRRDSCALLLPAD